MTKTFHSAASRPNTGKGQRRSREKPFDPAQYRLAAFDLDGTLLCGREPVHEPVRQALRALAERGVTVVASSGRNGTQFGKELSSLFQYAVLSNGSLTIDTRTNEPLFSHPIDRLIALYAIDRIRQLGGECFIQQGRHMIAPLKPFGSIMRECRKVPPAGRLRTFTALCRIFYGRSTVTTDSLRPAQKSGLPFYKLQAFVPSGESEPICEILARETGLNVLIMGDGTLELTAPGVSKANALRELACALGLSEENIAAFGDSMNDAEMLGRAGFSVAMQNGDPRLFASADRIAPPVDRDGAAQTIKALWRL